MSTSPTAPPRRLVYRPLTELAELGTPGNPKAHDIEAAKASIRRFGFGDPVLDDGRTGLVIAGHGRIEALCQLHVEGADVPEGIEATDGRWFVPTVEGWSSVNDTEARAFVVALNKIGEGRWRLPELAEWMTGANLEGIGFTAAELDDLFAGLEAPIDLPPGDIDAGHADLPPARKGDPPPPRQAQGLREVVLVYTVEQRREFDEMVARLRSAWGEDRPAVIVLRALAVCAPSSSPENQAAS